MKPEQKLKFPNEKIFVIETLNRQIEIALTLFYDGQIEILSTTVQRTNNPDNPGEIRVITRFSANSKADIGEKDCGQIHIHDRTPKVGDDLLSGQKLTSEYLAVLARIAE